MAELNAIPMWSDGTVVPSHVDIISGSWAQEEGLSPWGDYAQRGGEWVEVHFTLPEPEDAREGDTCTLHPHGGTGTYTAAYVFVDGQWSEAWSTVPWQLK